MALASAGAAGGPAPRAADRDRRSAAVDPMPPGPVADVPRGTSALWVGYPRWPAARCPSPVPEPGARARSPSPEPEPEPEPRRAGAEPIHSIYVFGARSPDPGARLPGSRTTNQGAG